jgi:hypothetical protein
LAVIYINNININVILNLYKKNFYSVAQNNYGLNIFEVKNLI